MSKIEKLCQFCNKPFNSDTRELNRGRAKYCSKSCANSIPKDQNIIKVCKHYSKE